MSSAASTAQWSEKLPSSLTVALSVASAAVSAGQYYVDAPGGALPVYETSDGNVFVFDAGAGDVLPAGAVLRRVTIINDTVMVL